MVLQINVGAIVAIMFAALVGGYIIASLLLLKYPTIIHGKKKHKFRAVHISHRGGAGENLENTITAFQHAIEVGTDMLEIDCHLAKNGEVVVCHDNDLTRITGYDQLIAETNYESLPALTNGLRLDFQHGHTTPGGTDRKIPLLREVFQQFPHTPINIDLKVDSDDLVEKINVLVEEYHRGHITVWGSRRQVICEKLSKQNPSLPRFFSFKRVVTITLLFYLGLLPFCPIKESYFEVLMPGILLSGNFRVALGKRRRFIIQLVDRLLINKVLFSHLKARGIQVYLWVLNDEESWHRAFQYGATGVMTDFPERLSQFLDKHPEYRTGHD